MWTGWLPFAADNHEFRTIPKEPGLYQIKPIGKDFLMYIGETRRTVHERMNELRHTLKRTHMMPWNESQTTTLSLLAGRMQKDLRTNVPPPRSFLRTP